MIDNEVKRTEVSAARDKPPYLAGKVTRDTGQEASRWQCYFDNSPYGIFVVGDDGRIRDVNREALSLCLFPRDHIHNMLFRNLVAESHRQGWDRGWRDLPTSRGFSLEIRFLPGTRQPLTCLADVSILPDGGALVYCRPPLAAHDPQNTREALDATAERFRRMIQNSSDIIVILDRQGRQLYVSPTAERITGFKPEELLRPMSDIIHPDDWESVAAAWGEGKQNPQEPVTVEFRHRHKNGGWVYMEAVGQSYMDDSVFQGVFVNTRDISERKIAQQAMLSLNQELERRVEERTSQLKAANDELEAFAYSVSHDLRAPLRTVEGFSAILAEDYADRMDEEAGKLIARIRNGARRMSLLIDDLLRLSRYSRSEIHCVEFDLTQIAREVASEVDQAGSDRYVEFVIQEGMTAKGDPLLIRVVLQNLIENAWKYTSRKHKAVIEIGLVCVDTEPVFYVRDNGVGFDMNNVRSLFEPFQRLHENSEYQGTGIGLATVQRIINRHFGKVWAEGRVDQGATVYFTLFDKNLTPPHRGV